MGKKRVRNLQVERVTMGLEGYIICARAACGEYYRFLVRDREVFAQSANHSWEALPKGISDIINYKFIQFHISGGIR